LEQDVKNKQEIIQQTNDRIASEQESKVNSNSSLESDRYLIYLEKI
jgi:hypothetical protein